MRKLKEYVKPFAVCLTVLGVLLALIGVLYVLLRAGTQPQDPTLEQQMNYLIHHQVGRILFWYGLVAAGAGIVCLLLGKTVLTGRE